MGATLGAVLLLCATAARAEDLFVAFDSLCVKTRADPAAALAAANSAGWMPVPTTLLKQFGASGEFKDMQGRLRSSEARLELLVVGAMEGKIGANRLNLQMCAVASLPPDGQLKKQLVDWVAVPQSQSLSAHGRLGYAFIDEGGVHRGVDPDSANTLKLLRDSRISIAAIQEDPQMSMAMFAVPTTTQSP